MTFKPIKYMGKNFDGYEMSDVDLKIRRISDQQEMFVDKESSKATLIGIDGTNKQFGIRTLYWHSWNQPLEGTSEVPLAKAQRGRKPKTDVVKKPKISLKTRKNELISSFALKQLQDAMVNRTKKGNSFRGIIINDGKNVECKVLLHHEEKKLLLVKMETQAMTKDGFWFMNPETGKSTRFIKEEHKLGYGDQYIVWPEVL